MKMSFRQTSAKFGLMAAACGLAVLVLFATAGPVQADTADYGDHSGSVADFLNVRETSSTDDVPLYGPPTVVDDALNFDPSNFSSDANMSADTTAGKLEMQIAAADGWWIKDIGVEELGSYSLLGQPGTMASVNSTVFVKVLEVDGSPLFGPNTNETLADDFFVLDVGESTKGGPWNGALTIDVQGMMADAGLAGLPTKVEMVVNNTLQTYAPDGLANIGKSQVGLNVGVNVVPEPSAGLLTAGGLLFAAIFSGGYFRTRQRRRA